MGSFLYLFPNSPYIKVPYKDTSVRGHLVTLLNSKRHKATKLKLENIIQERTKEIKLKNIELEKQKEEILTQREMKEEKLKK